MAGKPKKTILDTLESLEGNDIEDTLKDYVEETEENMVEEEPTDEIEIRKANKEALRQEMLHQREKVAERQTLDIRPDVYDIPDNFILLNKEDLPSKGMFYYPDTEIYIRSASVNDIRNWSMWESDDITVVDSKLNFILRNCCILKDPVNKMSWRDIKDMDRLYIVLAVRDLTFPPGTNDLMINVGQDKSIPVKKESVDFIELSDKLMNKYDEENRCFTVITPENKSMHFYVPSLGIAEWIKDYIIKKSRAQEPFDTEFCQLVPYMVKPGTPMDEKTYNHIYNTFKKMSIYEVSALSAFKELITESVNPTFTFEDEAGGKQTVPFSFLGGFRSLFVIQNIF